jgi:hypothetical protein
MDRLGDETEDFSIFCAEVCAYPLRRLDPAIDEPGDRTPDAFSKERIVPHPRWALARVDGRRGHLRLLRAASTAE